MKRLILVLLLIAPAAGFSQFKLTASGFINDIDTTKTYVVTNAPGSTQAQLYKSALLYLSSLYVSPKEVLSTIENESITVNAVANKAIKMKVLYLNPSWDLNYTVTFQFKDGKLRILQPSINRMTTQTGDVYRTASLIGGSGSNHKEIYNKKGELKQKDGKENLETFINAYVAAASKGILTAKNDNW